MKRRRMYLIPLSAIGVLVFAAVAVAQSTPEGIDASGNTTGVQNSTSIPGDAPVDSTTPTQSEPPPLTETSVRVNIHDHTFDPAQLKVAAGTTVTWINGDTEAHTVTADNELFDSRVLEPGQSYSTWLSGSGTVGYHCEKHPDMKGSVVVSGASEGGGTSTGDTAGSIPAQTGTYSDDPASHSNNLYTQLLEDLNQLPTYSPPT
jgi:plastocyanin